VSLNLKPGMMITIPRIPFFKTYCLQGLVVKFSRAFALKQIMNAKEISSQKFTYDF
jgi:hypothetical protein